MPLLLGWTGMRGVVSLAAALSIPVVMNVVAIPQRNLILFITFVVILSTLLIQGLTLPYLIRTTRLFETFEEEPEEHVGHNVDEGPKLFRIAKSNYPAVYPDDDASRSITIRTPFGFDLINAYVPNGQAVGTEKYAYKLAWLKKAKKFVQQHWTPSDKLVFVGDFNIAPDDRDVYDPVAWKEHIHCSAGERTALNDLVSIGFIDTFRMHDQSSGVFSWWDYRELSFARNKGLRIDLIYATPLAAASCRSVRIDKDERRGDKPSDHAPVIATFDF
jgi:exodeoxyribonuclease III